MLRPELPDSFPPYKKVEIIGKIAKENIEKTLILNQQIFNIFFIYLPG